MSEPVVNILLTCAGRRVALLRAFREALAALGLRGRVLACDVSPASPALRLADEGLLSPPVADATYGPWLRERVRRHAIGLLAPMTDLDLMFLAERRDEFAESGCTVMVASAGAAEMCRDKARLEERVEAAGLTPIRTWPLEAFRRSPSFPCFVKPARGSGGIGAGRIDDERALKAHVATYGDELIVQEYVGGPETTLDVYRDRGGRVRCVVPRRRLRVRSGEVEVGMTVADEELIEATVRLCGHLGDLWGVFCCQCRCDESGRARFFEVNPRFGGGAPLSIAAGADLPRYLLEEVTGRPISARLGAFTPELVMARYDEAVFFRSEAPEDLPGYDRPIFR